MTGSDPLHNDLTGKQRPLRGRSLMPREHGAYAELLFPLTTALGLGGFTAAQWLLAIAAVAVFLAHESFLVLIGERGRRYQAESGKRARAMAAGLLGVAIAAGAAGLWLGPDNARLAVLLPLGLGLWLTLLIFRHRERTLSAEILVGWTLASTLLPVALAGGIGLRAAITAGVVWGAVFSLATLTVRTVIASAKHRREAARQFPVMIALNLAVIGLAFLLAVTRLLPIPVALAVLPFALVALTCNLFRVRPHHLRAIGWSLVGSNAVALAALLIGLS